MVILDQRPSSKEKEKRRTGCGDELPNSIPAIHLTND
jgi:hypothetical protein